MKKKDTQNQQQVQAAPPKKGIRLSTIVEVFMFITGILLTAMFFLPVYKDTVKYNSDYFKLDNLLNVFPDNAASYLDLAGRFLDDRNVAVTVMIFAFMLVMPILLAVLTFPKLRKISALSIIPIIILVAGQFFFGFGFTVEQKALELAPFGYFYSVLVFQLPMMYLIFIIQSIIEKGRMKREAKNAPAMDPSYQQFAPQGGFGQQPMEGPQFGGPQGGFGQQPPMNDQQFAPQGGFGQQPPMNDQQFAPQSGFGQPMEGPQFGGPQGGFGQPAPMSDQQFAPQNDFQQAPFFNEQPQNSFVTEAPEPAPAPEPVPVPAPEPVFAEPAFSATAEPVVEAPVNFEEAKESVTEDLSEKAPEVAETVDNTVGTIDASIEAPQAEEPVKMQPAFCQQCGAKLEQGALFCMQCGSPVK